MTHAPLEPSLAALIETRTGPIQDAERTARGYTSDYTGTIRAASGRVFIKAARDPGRLTSSLEREAASKAEGQKRPPPGVGFPTPANSSIGAARNPSRARYARR